MNPSQAIESRIFLIRGHRVLIDSDLALMYGVTTKRLNEQVRRNIDRFPADFGFQLLLKELQILRSQNATSSWGGRRYLPWVFTEHGALMLATVLSTPLAVQAGIEVVRAFIRLRALALRFDGKLKTVSDAIRLLMQPPTQA